MATKVCIIPVDLGADIRTIITEEILTITDQNREQLDIAVATARAETNVRTQRELVKRAHQDGITGHLQRAQEMLLASGENGVSADEIMRAVQPLITTTSAFSLRMKTHLKAQGNPYVMIRKKDRYYMEAYNQEVLPPIESPPQ